MAAEVYAETAAAWDAVAPSVALDATWRLIREANALLEATEPWKAEPGPEVDGVLGDALEVLRLVAILASPALTRASGEVWRRIGLSGSPTDERLPDAAAWGGYPGGLPVEKGGDRDHGRRWGRPGRRRDRRWDAVTVGWTRGGQGRTGRGGARDDGGVSPRARGSAAAGSCVPGPFDRETSHEPEMWRFARDR